MGFLSSLSSQSGDPTLMTSPLSEVSPPNMLDTGCSQTHRRGHTHAGQVSCAAPLLWDSSWVHGGRTRARGAGAPKSAPPPEPAHASPPRPSSLAWAPSPQLLLPLKTPLPAPPSPEAALTQTPGQAGPPVGSAAPQPALLHSHSAHLRRSPSPRFPLLPPRPGARGGRVAAGEVVTGGGLAALTPRARAACPWLHVGCGLNNLRTQTPAWVRRHGTRAPRSVSEGQPLGTGVRQLPQQLPWSHGGSPQFHRRGRL